MSLRPQKLPVRTSVPSRSLMVFRSRDIRVVEGVNEGDPLGEASDLVLEDIHALRADAAPVRLGLDTSLPRGPFRISPDSGAGTPGALVHLDCLVTFMSAEGDTSDALVLVELDTDGTVRETYLHPLAPLAPGAGYTLVTIDRDGAAERLAGTADAAFTRGTRITLANGTQRKIEDLRPGDRILTRDAGPRTLRSARTATLRADRAFAPVRIAAGTFGNAADLVVGPRQRLCLSPFGGAGDLVTAARLVDGCDVRDEPGGFVDYIQLVFDGRAVIFAEGIAVECREDAARDSATGVYVIAPHGASVASWMHRPVPGKICATPGRMTAPVGGMRPVLVR